jgi:hypothetical protein
MIEAQLFVSKNATFTALSNVKRPLLVKGFNLNCVFLLATTNSIAVKEASIDDLLCSILFYLYHWPGE